MTFVRLVATELPKLFPLNVSCMCQLTNSLAGIEVTSPQAVSCPLPEFQRTQLVSTIDPKKSLYCEEPQLFDQLAAMADCIGLLPVAIDIPGCELVLAAADKGFPNGMIASGAASNRILTRRLMFMFQVLPSSELLSQARKPFRYLLESEPGPQTDSSDLTEVGGLTGGGGGAVRWPEADSRYGYRRARRR